MENHPREATLNWKILEVRASFWRIVLPPILTVLLFVSTIFLLIMPFIENSVFDRKREMVRELVSVAWSDIQTFEKMEQAGQLTRPEAQSRAREHVRAMRFGAEGTDYFWINDRHPFMIMHPYRTDLEGQDVSQFTDPNGKMMFSAMVQVVEEQGDGYVDYMWQWKDDASHIVPKISYVKGFEPWGWIIGTGIYIEDAQAEIDNLTRDLVWACAGVVFIVFILGTWVILQGVASRQRWRKAEDEARHHLARLSHLSRLHTIKTMATEIAHQIDQPLGSILLRSSLCTDTLKEGDRVTPDLIENLEEISIQVERTSQIVKRIRDFTRRRELERKVEDLNAIVGEVLDFIAPELRKNKVYLGFFPGKAPSAVPDPIWVNVDKTLIEQVVMNIVHNANDALLECPAEDRKLIIHTEVSANQVLVVFEDTGPGIAEDQLETVFESFQSSKEEGLGIGLSICRSIIEEHEGRLWAESGSDQGGVLKFTLPLEA